MPPAATFVRVAEPAQRPARGVLPAVGRASRELRRAPVSEPLEHEADRVARQALRTPSQTTRCACGGTAGPDGECSACKRRRLERGSAPGLHTDLSLADAPALGHGSALPTPLRAELERRFGHDFDDVRVHTGAQASAAARTLHARALTVGHDIAFAAGEYRPATPDGLNLLGHELTHVIQQRRLGRRVQRKPKRCEPTDARFTVTAPADMLGAELLIQTVMLGDEVTRERAEQMVTDGTVKCDDPACRKGLRAGESIDVCYPRSPPPRPPALVQGALDNWRLRRFIEVGSEKGLLKLLGTYRAGDFDAILAIHHMLLALDRDDVDCYWRWVAGGGVPEGWVNIAGSLAGFTEVRERFCHPVEVEDTGMDRLGGTERVYALITEHDRLQRELLSRRLGESEMTAVMRGEETSEVLAAKLEVVRVARDKALREAGFADAGAYRTTANEFRVRFRTRAVAVLKHELAAAANVMADAHSRYRIIDEPGSRPHVTPACQELYDQIRAARSKDTVVAVHPILAAPGVWDELSRARDVFEFSWRLTGFALQRSHDVDLVKFHADDDPDIVFKFEPIVERTRELLAVQDDSIFDVVVKEQVGKPGPPLWRQLVDIGLLVLSFVPGPIGFAARLTSAGLHVGGEVTGYQVLAEGHTVGVRREAPSAAPILYAGAWEILPQTFFSLVGRGYRAIKGAREASRIAGTVGTDVARTESSALATATETEAKAGAQALPEPTPGAPTVTPDVASGAGKAAPHVPEPPPPPPVHVPPPPVQPPPPVHQPPPPVHQPPPPVHQPPPPVHQPPPPVHQPPPVHEPAPGPPTTPPPSIVRPPSRRIQDATQRIQDTQKALAAAGLPAAERRALVAEAERELGAARELLEETAGSPEARHLVADAEETLANARRGLKPFERSEAIAQIEAQAATAAGERITALEDKVAALDRQITAELNPRGGFTEAEKWAGRRPGRPPLRHEPGYERWADLEQQKKQALRELESEEAGLARSLEDQVEAATPGAAGQGPALHNASTLDPPLQPVNGVPIDVTTGRPIEGPWTVDHIMARSEIARDPRFARLTPWQRDAMLLDIPENYLPMTVAANSSKGGKRVARWILDRADKEIPLPDEVATALREADRRAREAIEARFRLYIGP